jgi:hypothetical protein
MPPGKLEGESLLARCISSRFPEMGGKFDMKSPWAFPTFRKVDISPACREVGPARMDSSQNPLRDALVSLSLAAKTNGLPFLLVGGNALIHYGLPRFTRDIDLLVPESSVGRWKEFLQSRGFLCFHSSDAFLQFAGEHPGLAPVDLMVVGSDTWEKLVSESETAEVSDGLLLALPSPLHLIAMKLQAYRSPRRRSREQDWSDILHLVNRFVPDPAAEDFKLFATRHGGEMAYDRLCREFLPPSS